MNDDKQYPISEIFTSWQGEGLWSGTRMTFIRFAGCNVGKPFKGEYVRHTDDKTKVIPWMGPGLAPYEGVKELPIWQEECTSWDGRKFLCDTDFRVKERLTAKEILDRVPKNVTHLCFTGGEPLLHAQGIDYIKDIWYEKVGHYNNPIIHIETSGTIIFDYNDNKDIWITVSPKLNCKKEMIQRANEVKFLVDENFPESKAEELASYDTDNDTIFWLSSINSIDFLDKNNMDKCKEIAEHHPTWRITQQAHKIWGVR